MPHPKLLPFQENRVSKAFTLIELITVIAIIAILMGLLLPAVTAVRNQANKAKAKSDVLNIVTAVKGFYTDYGQYPMVSGTTTTLSVDTIIGPGQTYTNNMLMDILRAVNTGINTRQVVYLDAPNVKSPAAPKGGIATQSVGSVTAGDFVDPWGLSYYVAIDYNYDNVINNTASGWPWTDVTSVRAGVISWSYGIDGKPGTNGVTPVVLNATSGAQASDDVVSFQ